MNATWSEADRGAQAQRIETDPLTSPGPRKQSYRPLLLLLLVCIAPVIASYSAYYVWPPAGRTNYGELISPQRPLPNLPLRQLDGSPFDAVHLKGRWMLVSVDHGACDAICARKLWNMRQVRIAVGKEQTRVARAWFVLDDVALSTEHMREYEGTLMLRTTADALSPYLVLPANTTSEPTARLQDHIWLIDPLGNLMMRWPKSANPARMKRDLDRLLRASRIG